MQFLRTRLASHLKPFAIVVIILLQLQSIYVAFSLNSNIEQRTNSYLDESALLASAVIDQRIVQVVTGLEQLARTVSQEMKRMDADTACDALLYNYKKTWQYSDLFLLAPDGTELVRAVHDISDELKIARRALESKSPAFGKSSLSDSITYAIPVFDGEDVVAVLICSRGTEKAHQLLEVSVMSNAGFILLVDYDKNVLVKKWNASREDLRGRVNFLTTDNKLDTSVFGPGYDLREHGHAEFKDVDGKAWLLAQRSKKEFGLALLYVTPADVLMQNIPSLRWWNSASNFVSFVLILFLMGDLLWLQRAYRRKLDEVEFGDVLTRGDNSAGFSKKLKKLLDNTSISYALITLDINKFKLINDEYGVTTANDFLRLVHDILSDHLVSDELCARHNADTFLLLLHFSDEARLRERLDGMMNEVMLRKHALGMQHKYGLSAGVYVITDRDMPPYIMVDNANFAREQCKKPPHPSCVFYDESVQEKLRNEAEILNTFTNSLEHGCFEIWLQPKVNIRTDIVIGAEALVRWNHPVQGFLAPAMFLPVLEQNNRIVQLDLWVFEEVCRMLARWDREAREIVPVSVNLSRAHLANENFLNNYLKILQFYNINPHWIELELTETLFMENEERISQIFSSIRSHGLRCAIDDFGTGYSSLSMLRNANVDTVKLDRSFFSSPELSDQSKAIIRSITQLSSALSLACVAEGVEDRSNLEFLLSTDCSAVQGYLYSKPLTVEAFEAFSYTKEKRRKILNSGILDNMSGPIQHFTSQRSLQMRELLSGLGNVGVYVVKKSTREVLYCNPFLKSASPNVQEGRFCHELWANYCSNCPLTQMEQGKSPTIIAPSSDFGCPVSVTAVEILWEDYIPAYAITLVPLGQGEEEKDVLRLRSQMADWKKKAQEDSLTNLLSKNQFETEVTKRLESDAKGSLFFIDLDGFKQVNDSFGHLMGDEVLKNTAERIRLSFRRDDLIGRYGGDEFIVYASAFTDEELLDRRLDTLKNLLRHQHTLNGVFSAISASIGVARFPEDAVTFTELVRRADMALYEAKRRGKDQHVYYSDKLMPKTEK